MWRSGKRLEAITGLDDLVRKITATGPRKSSSTSSVSVVSGVAPAAVSDPSLSKMFLRLASWQRALSPGNLDEGTLRKCERLCILFFCYYLDY